MHLTLVRGAAVTQLDIHTLLGVLAVLNIFLSVVMALYWRTQRVYPGFGLWTLCNACVGLLWVLFFFRGRIPLGVSVVLPNVLAGVAVVLRLEGLRRFLGRARFDFRVLAVPAVILVLFLVFLYARDDVFARTATTTLSVGLVVWVMAGIVLARASGAARFAYLTIGTMWVLYGALNVARGVYWLAAYEGNPLMQPGLFNEMYYVATAVFDIGWTVVFITMNHQRTAVDLGTAHAAAEATRDRLADIIAFLPDATFAIDRDMRVIAYNRAAEQLIGLPASTVLGRRYGDAVALALGGPGPILLDLALNPGGRVPERYSTVAREGDKVSAEMGPIELGGRHVSIWGAASPLRDAKGEIVGAIESIRDVTPLKRAERERVELLRRLLESQRLESLGVMAGGISHDYNNLLAIILGNLDLAAATAPKGSHQSKQIADAAEAARRAAQLTENMRAYARASALTLVPVDLADLIDESRPVLQQIVGDCIVLEFALDGTPKVKGDNAALLQVVNALVMNAAESIPDGRGVVRIATGAVDCDERLIACSLLTEKPAPGRFVFVRVSDTGVGMGRETVDRMLDPFYTTKFTGRGLGMSAASGIVVAHGGVLTVDSTPAQGTDVTVLLPVSGD